MDVGDNVTASATGYLDLTIEKIAEGKLSVAHYFKQNGDMMRDPEVVFEVFPHKIAIATHPVAEPVAPNPFGPTTTGWGPKLPDVTDTSWRGSLRRGTPGDGGTASSRASESGSESGDRTGVVLAGGYSRRFGDRDKALGRLGGRPLLARVVDRLGATTDNVVVNCRADQRAAFADALDHSADSEPDTDGRVQFAADPIPDRGPLFGFRTALRTVDAEICVLAACDTPFLDAQLVADLADRLAADPAAEAVAVLTDDRPHPMPAVYRTKPALGACDALLDAGDGRLAALFDRLTVRRVSADDAAGDVSRSLFDVDTPADHKRAAAALADQSTSEVGPEIAPPR